MPRPRNQVPTYRLHKQSGQAIITINHDGTRRDMLLGVYGSPESKQEYQRILGELRSPAGPAGIVSGSHDITVAEVMKAFLVHVDQHYRHPDGTPTSEVHNFKLSIRVLRELYAHTPAVEFGPKALKVVRQAMIDRGWCRKQINARISRIRRGFKWAASEELIPVDVFQALATVTGLQAGRSAAVDREPIAPVSVEHIAAVVPLLNRHVRGLIEFQRLTGCRPGEACSVRRVDILDTPTGRIYKPASHKTAWRGKSRTISIGPRAWELLQEFITDDPTDYLFSPRRAVLELHASRAAARKTPCYPSHVKRNAAKRKDVPQLAPAGKYTITAYGTAIDRACDKAGIPHWNPGQIRHTFATTIRERFGLEAAQVLLGHARADVTQVYAERDLGLAAKVAGEVG